MIKAQGAVEQIMHLVRSDSKYARCALFPKPLRNIRTVKIPSKHPIQARIIFAPTGDDISFDEALEATLITERKALNALAKR